MMMQIMYLLLLNLLLFSSGLTSSSTTFGLQAKLTRIHSKLPRTAIQGNYSTASKIQSLLHLHDWEFLMDVQVGDPPIQMSMLADTGSDLIWFKCPSRTATYRRLRCNIKNDTMCIPLPTFTCTQDSYCQYKYGYIDKTWTKGMLSSETFTFGSNNNSVRVPNIVVGCGNSIQSPTMASLSGIIGLGNSPKSLVRQLGVGRFSYCLTSFEDPHKTSPILFGSGAMLDDSNVRSTPLLLHNPNLETPFYYLTLHGITVGTTFIEIPRTFSQPNEDGSGGFIIDSGTPITRLEPGVYQRLSEALENQLDLPIRKVNVGNVSITCFSWQPDMNIPKLVFHFDRGADMDLTENYMSRVEDEKTMCLIMIASTNPGSILGNYQQQNIHILYDLEHRMLSFAPAKCDRL